MLVILFICDFLFQAIRETKIKNKRRKEGGEGKKKRVVITEMENFTDEREDYSFSVDFEILQNCFWDHVSLMEHKHARPKIRNVRK